MTSCGAIPRHWDKAHTYLYLKEWTNKLIKTKNQKSSSDTLRVLLLASLNNAYVEGCAQTLQICGQTVRNHLKTQDPQSILQINQQVIQEMKKKGALTKPLVLAMDWHEEMYYGNPQAEGVVGAKPRNGTCHAYRFATASVLIKGERVTLAVVPMLDRCILEHVKRLLACVFELGLSVRLLLFDRGYYSGPLIRYLNSVDLKYVMHIPWRGKPLEAGIDCLYATVTHKRRVLEQADFRLVTMKDKGRVVVFATNASFKPRKVLEVFRLRWGIETSYRLIGMFLARTTSRFYPVRLLYFFLAVLLYNLWVLRNFRRRVTVSVWALRHVVVVSLVLSWLPDLEAGG